MYPFLHKGAAGLLLVTLVSCYDAPRENPFDPALTPAVALQVALDDTAGTATLTWTQYEGKQPFQEYQVLRNIADRKSVDTLAHLSQVEQTSFVDTTLIPNTAYGYRVETVNAGGYAAPSEERNIAGFSLGVVQLTAVESDLQAGGLVLRWNRYVGPDFTSYQVHRRQVGTDREEMLAEIAVPTDTTFTDQTAQAGVDYLYTLTVQAAGQKLASNTYETRFRLPPVLLSAPQFDARTASASLVWTHYEGPRFQAYRVERRTAGLTPQVVQELVDLTSTAYVDTGLVGNTEYFYQVVVETERGEEVLSEEQRGAFHQLLATWPLAIAEGEYVRLYWEGEGITALMAGEERVRLLFYGAQGEFTREQVLLDNPDLNIEPRGAATSLGLAGQRFLSLNIGRNTSSNRMLVWHFDATGKPVLKEIPVFADFLGSLSGEYAQVQGEITLRMFSPSTNDARPAFLDNVIVARAGQVLFAEDFEDGVGEGWSEITPGTAEVAGTLVGQVRKADASWQDFRLEADAVILTIIPQTGRIVRVTTLSIAVGTPREDSNFILRLSKSSQVSQVEMTWTFLPSQGSDLKLQRKNFTAPFPIILGVPYRLGLEVVQGQVRASVSSPFFWSSEQEEAPSWASLAGLGERLVLMAGEQPYRFNAEEVDSAITLLETPASEIRIWENPADAARPWMGACLPVVNQVAMVKTGVSPTGQLLGVTSLATPARTLGTGAGQEPGAFLYPLSLDGSSDGRVYVLDAGNARIQVFDIEGTYITQWGRKGSGEGEFDFGSGRVPEDFVGSVAVDEDGYIYVADVGNQRIQKFAP